MILVTLNNKENYWSPIIYLLSLVNIFHCEFRVLSELRKQISVIFSVII